jgi:hypothetical protein
MLNWLWNVSWVVDENVNVLKWLVWGWYNIVLWCMLNQLWDVDEIGLLMNVKPIMECWLSCWLALANGIRYRWSSCVWWLVSTNDIQDGWPGCDCWFQDGWQGCDCWLALANGIRDGWSGCDCWLASVLMASEMDDRVVIVD